MMYQGRRTLFQSIEHTFRKYAADCCIAVALAGALLSTVPAQAQVIQLRPVIPDTLDEESTPVVEAKQVGPVESGLVGKVVTDSVVQVATGPVGQVEKESFNVNGVAFDMVRVGGGTFIMGAAEDDPDAYESERPAHLTVVGDFYIGETEVTQQLWEAVMGTNPSKNRGKMLPVECVRFVDIDLFLMKLEYYTGKRFRLPTEAEWEYAARGGRKSRHTKYAGCTDQDPVAWYCNNSGNHTHEVMTKAPNELGIYDMSGNVEEWCDEVWKRYDNPTETLPDAENEYPEGAEKAKVCRGGGFLDFPRHLRVSDRRRWEHTIFNPDIGLRLAM